MKHLLGILLMATLWSLPTHAQFQPGDWIVGGQWSSHATKYGEPFGMFTIDLNYFVHERVSLNHTYAFSEGYFRVPAGYALAAAIGGLSGDVEGLLALFMIPEGVTYFHPMGRHFTMGTYVNLIGVEFNDRELEQQNEWNLNGAIGARAYALLGERWVLNASVEMRMAYTEPNRWGNVNIGGGLGYRFYYDIF
ncbi:MAG: hypothetical protein ACFB10_16535 [Salibacteraceae bacterium]